MRPRKYLFPGVIELNLQAGRPLGVNIYLIDGGTEFALIDVGQDDTLDEVIEMIRDMDFQLSKCKLLIATHADADHIQGLAGLANACVPRPRPIPAPPRLSSRETSSKPTPASRRKTSTFPCRPARST